MIARRLTYLVRGCVFCVLATCLMPMVWAQNKKVIELETTTIKGNTELPKYMYVVPWQDNKNKKAADQKLVLHNLYSDLFDPVLPEYLPPFKRAPVLQSGPPQ